jgi:uncharacterized protein (DUF362 family)
MKINESCVGLALLDRNIPFVGYKDPKIVGALISKALCNTGLGQEDHEAPFRDIIKPGMTVLIKPNWVLHENMSGKGMDCMITHPVFIEEVVKQVAKASPGRIIIADAPIQRTIFLQVASLEWQERLRSLIHPCRLEIIDLRKSVWLGSGGESHVESGLRNQSDYVLFDIGSRSFLEPISTPIGRFRSTCYDPDVLTKTHRPGCHQYLLCREFFEADVVINLPKLKTHRKAGITAALKNLVGINGDKDFLPHHRIGGSVQGGDCYEGKTIFKHIAERIVDRANRKINTKAFYPLFEIGYFFIKLNNLFYGDDEMEGGWYGNDTVWRMVLDLNRIALYGGKDGSMSSEPQRQFYSLTDAVIAGEAHGPLAPEPVHLGAVTFAASSAYADLVHSALMRFDWKKISLIKHAFERFDYPLTSAGPEDVSIVTEGNTYKISELAEQWGVNFRPAKGWIGHVELGC